VNLRTQYNTVITVTLAVAVMMATAVSVTWQWRDLVLEGRNDFLSFYAGAKLAFTNQLHVPEAVQRVQADSAGATADIMRFVRPPHYAMLLSPLALLPYKMSYLLWQALNILAAVLAVVVWPGRRIVFAHILAACMPLYISFANGQDLGLMLFGVAGTVRLMHHHSPRAGLPLALCMAKFHFIWLAPLALVRDTRTLKGFVGLAVVLVALPFLVNSSWPVDYYDSVVRERALVSKVPLSLFVVTGWIGPVLAAAIAAYMAWRFEADMALCGAIAAAIVFSPHAYFQDYVLVTPLVALVWQRWQERKQAGRRAIRPSITEARALAESP
jgi:hypothetical protein